MKFRIYFALILAFLNVSILSQWSPDSRLTSDPAFSGICHNNGRTFVQSSGILHLAFFDDRVLQDHNDIYIKSSSDSGLTWSPEVKLTDTTEPSQQQVLSSNGQTLHLAWFTGKNWLGTYNLFYKRSTDNGITWGSNLKLTGIQGYYFSPSISVSGQFVHIVFMDTPGGNGSPVIKYVRSTDGGITWSSAAVLVSGHASTASITTEGNNVHIVWQDRRMIPNKIFYKRSTDNGLTWSLDTVVSGPTSSSFDPCISSSGNRINVIWEDLQFGSQTEIVYTYSTNNGISWQPETRLTNDPSYSEDPSVISSGSYVHATWWDGRAGNSEIYYKNSTDGGISWSPDIRITNATGASQEASVHIFGSVLHLIWNDGRDGNFEVYYKRNPNGNMVGISNITNNTPNEFSLSQNYPNPFNPSTKIRFSVPKQAEIAINLSDITGRIISSIVQPKQFAAGVYEVDFDGSNLATGIYFYSLNADGIKLETKKMVLIK